MRWREGVEEEGGRMCIKGRCESDNRWESGSFKSMY